MKTPKRLLAFYDGKLVDMNAALAERVPDAKQRFRYACMRVVDNAKQGYVIEGDKVYFLSPASRMAKIVTGEARDKVIADIAALSHGSRARRVYAGRLRRLSRFGNQAESAFDRAPDLVKRNVVLDVQEMARFELGKHITLDEARHIARTLGQRSVKSIYYVSARNLRKLIEAKSRGDAIRVRFPGSEKTVLDTYTGKQVHAIKGVIRRTARKHKAEEIRRIRRMLAKAKPGSMQEHNLRAYMAVLLRKAGGTGKRYVADEKALPSWRDVPDYKRRGH